MFNQFPRECGPPRKLVKNKKEMLNYINIYNGKKKAIYSSIYYFRNIITENNGYSKVDYNSVVVDKLFFDFDDKSCNAYQQVKQLHEYCLKENLKHIIVMSGRGYHLYILTASSNLKHSKEAVRGGQLFFIEKLNLKIDSQVIGNTSQLARIPNTFHPKAGRFCIPLTQEQFDKGDEFIKQLSQQQNFVTNIVIGSKYFDLSRFDVVSENNFEGIELKNIKCYEDVEIKHLPLCIQKLLSKKDLGWKERYLVILYFKEKGYSMEEVYKILKKYLSEKKLQHCVKEEKQLQYLFERNDLMFPSCERLENEGFCVGKCDFYNNLVYV